MSCAVCLNVRLQHMNTTNTYTDKHACRDLRAAAWVILSLDVGTEHFGKGGVREVYVRFGYTFSFCLHCVLLIEITRSPGFADACAQTCDWQTHTCACAGDVLPPAGEYTTGIASDYFLHHPDMDILLPSGTFDVWREIMCKTSYKLFCTYLSSL